MAMAAAVALLPLLPCFVLAFRNSEGGSSTAPAVRMVPAVMAERTLTNHDCPEQPEWDYSKDPPGCQDSETEMEVDDECCTEERLCGAKAQKVIDKYKHRLIDVYVAKCGLNQESDLAKSTSGGKVQVQITNPEPLCSAMCQNAEELEAVADGTLPRLSEECAAYPEVAALVSDSEHVIITRAVDAAWEQCAKTPPQTKGTGSQPVPDDDDNCPERPEWDYSKDPPGCQDSETEMEVDDECCTEERLCGAKTQKVIDEYKRRLIDVYVAKCGMNQESDLAKSTSGGKVQITNPEPLCSAMCQNAEELEAVADGTLPRLSEECAAYPKVAALVDNSEHVIITRAMDAAWERCSKRTTARTTTTTTTTLQTPAVDPEDDCPPGFFPRQCLVESNLREWIQSLSRRGCRGNLLVLRPPSSLAGLTALLGPARAPAVLLRVKGTKAVTDPMREIPKGLEISAETLPKHADLQATRGITVKHKDGRALDLEVLDADGNVKRTFYAATSLTFAQSPMKNGADVIYKYTTINLLWHLGHWIGVPVSPPGTEIIPSLPTVSDDRLMMCSDKSAKHVNEPDPVDEPPEPSSPYSNHDWEDWSRDEPEKEEPVDDKDEPVVDLNDQPSEDKTAGDQSGDQSHSSPSRYVAFTDEYELHDPFGPDRDYGFAQP